MKPYITEHLLGNLTCSAIQLVLVLSDASWQIDIR